MNKKKLKSFEGINTVEDALNPLNDDLKNRLYDAVDAGLYDCLIIDFLADLIKEKT